MKILDRSDRADVEDARRIFREDLESALSKAIKALEKDDCRALFHGANPSEVLTNIVQGKKYGDIKAKMLKPEGAAQTGRKWWNPLEVRIDISMREGSGYWLNLDEEGRGFLLLHELGHVFHRLFDGSDLKDNDTGDSAEAEENRKINDKLLSDNCIGRQL